MENNQQILNKIKLMMSYELGKTLNENVKSIPLLNETQVEVEEDAFLKGAVDAFKDAKALKVANPRLFTALDDVLKRTAKDGLQIKGITKPGTVQHVAITDVNGLVNSIKAGMKPAEVAQLYKGLLKSKNTPANVLQSITRDVVESNKFIKSYGGMTDKQLRAELANRGYSDLAIDSIAKEAKNNKLFKNTKVKGAGGNVKGGNANVSGAGGEAKAVGGTNVTVNVNQTVGGASGDLTKAAEEATKAGDNKIKEILDDAKKLPDEKPSRWARWKAWGERNPKSKKLLYLLGFGGATYAAYKMLFSDTTPEQAKQLTFSNCAGSLVDDAGTKILTTSGGDPVLKVTKTGNQEYDSKGGLMFYNNGRVFMVDQSKRGYWSCKGKQTFIDENNLLNEQGAELTDAELDTYVNDAIDDLDGYVAEYNLQSLLDILTALKGKTYKGKSALQEFLRFYKEDEGADFLADVNSVGVANLSITAKNMKPQIVAMISGAATGGGDGKSATGVDSIINIKWDGAKSGGGGDEVKKSGQKYYDCSGVNLDTTALTYGCKDNRIAEVQKCLGVTADGKFGPATRKALTDNAYDMSKGITKEIYAKIIAGCKKGDMAAATTGTTGNSLADVSYLRNPIKLDLGPTPELPKFSRNTETNEDFYNRLVANGNFRAGEIGSNRVKYKGTDLNVDDLKKLNDFVVSKGYKLIKNKDKGAQYGGGENDKYVWQKSE